MKCLLFGALALCCSLVLAQQPNPTQRLHDSVESCDSKTLVLTARSGDLLRLVPAGEPVVTLTLADSDGFTQPM